MCTKKRREKEEEREHIKTGLMAIWSENTGTGEINWRSRSLGSGSGDGGQAGWIRKSRAALGFLGSLMRGGGNDQCRRNGWVNLGRGRKRIYLSVGKEANTWDIKTLNIRQWAKTNKRQKGRYTNGN